MSTRVAMVSTYPPTRCGTATFAQSMATSMTRLGQDIRILRLSDGEPRSSNSMFLGDHTSNADIPQSAHLLNQSDVVILQHAFDIYPGSDGAGVLDLLGEITVPVITILHSVTERPTHPQRRIMQGLIQGSDVVIPLSYSAWKSLSRSYDFDPEKSVVLPHGAPDIRGAFRPNKIRMRPRILTWGFLHQGKGIEWAIEAMALLKDFDPIPDYYIVGQTRPTIADRDGHSYRDGLRTLARKFGVDDRVHFVDGYLDEVSLTRLITSADIYLLPYDTREQATSGVLTEALAAGGPVVATEFPHAVELLGDGTGSLVKHENPAEIAAALRMLIEDPGKRMQMREMSAAKAPSLLWSAVGASMSSLAKTIGKPERRFTVDQPLTQVSA